jgi:hypothetical protein
MVSTHAVANELGMTDGILDGTIRIHVHYDQKGKMGPGSEKTVQSQKGRDLWLSATVPETSPCFRQRASPLLSTPDPPAG